MGGVRVVDWDARSLPQAAQEELRRCAAKLVVNEGHKQVAVAASASSTASRRHRR